MKRINLLDNSRNTKEALAEIPHLTARIVDKTLRELEQAEGLFVFPTALRESRDIAEEQYLLRTVGNDYYTGNVMGFLGCDGEYLEISSRFSSSATPDHFLRYMLERVFDLPNVINDQVEAERDTRVLNLLVFIFPHYLQAAMRKGPYKEYVRNEYNDAHISGPIDIARHVRLNTPFLGKVAYAKREYSYDNHLMALIRHTIEYIATKAYGKRILSKIKDEVSYIRHLTPSYHTADRTKIIHANRTHPMTHAYYREYRDLQELCLLILQNQKHQIGMGTRRINGILFDGAWLWEEYLNLLVKDRFYHPRNKEKEHRQKLFTSGYGSMCGEVYPDFISRATCPRSIADAKYKPIDNIQGKDYLQILAYMLRFDARIGYFLYPEAPANPASTAHQPSTHDTVLYLNSGTTYDTVKPRSDICVIKHPLRIPGGAPDYQAFVRSMRQAERQFTQALRE